MQFTPLDLHHVGWQSYGVNYRIDAMEKKLKEVWLDNQEIMQMLKISKRTLQHYLAALLPSLRSETKSITSSLMWRNY
jgi:hypothetical protein